MKLPKTVVLFSAAAVFLLGGVNLFPCAAGAETAQDAKKSCHSKTAEKNAAGKENKKREKPCCSLHCYNPAHMESLPLMPIPAIASVTIANEDVPFFSLTFSPPLPPPRAL